MKKVVKSRNIKQETRKQIDEPTIAFPEDFFIVDKIKSNIVFLFKNNLNLVQELILSLKSTPIDYLVNKIDLMNEELNGFKEDFETKLNSLFDLKNKGLNSTKNE